MAEEHFLPVATCVKLVKACTDIERVSAKEELRNYCEKIIIAHMAEVSERIKKDRRNTLLDRDLVE